MSTILPRCSCNDFGHWRDVPLYQWLFDTGQLDNWAPLLLLFCLCWQCWKDCHEILSRQVPESRLRHSWAKSTLNPWRHTWRECDEAVYWNLLMRRLVDSFRELELASLHIKHAAGLWRRGQTSIRKVTRKGKVSSRVETVLITPTAWAARACAHTLKVFR